MMSAIVEVQPVNGWLRWPLPVSGWYCSQVKPVSLYSCTASLGVSANA